MVCLNVYAMGTQDDILLKKNTFVYLKFYAEDLTHRNNRDFDIVKVELYYARDFLNVLLDPSILFGTNYDSGRVLWERPEDYTVGEITKEKAESFYEDLHEKIYGNTIHHGSIDTEMVAETMGIGDNRANEFCNAMIRYGITELESGTIVI